MSHFGQVVLSSITAIERGPKLFDIRIDLRIRLGGTVGRILGFKTNKKLLNRYPVKGSCISIWNKKL
jgi:hypothetical protein